jgi:hypothetical protein
MTKFEVHILMRLVFLLLLLFNIFFFFILFFLLLISQNTVYKKKTLISHVSTTMLFSQLSKGNIWKSVFQRELVQWRSRAGIFWYTAVRNSNGDLRCKPRFNSSKRCRNLRKRRWARTLWSELWISVWLVHRCLPNDFCSTVPLNKLPLKNQFFLRNKNFGNMCMSLLTSGL